MMYRRIPLLLAGAAMLANVITATSAWAAAATSPPTATPSPQPCAFAGGRLVSGDAGRASDGQTWVCTDGTLVRVASYGNQPLPHVTHAATLPHDYVTAHRIADDTYRITVANLAHSELDPTVVAWDGHGRQPYVLGFHTGLVRKGHSVTVTVRFPRDDTFRVLWVDSTVPGNPDSAYSDAVHGQTVIRVR